MRYRTLLVVLALVAAAPAAVAEVQPDQQALANAVASLMLVDNLRQRCPTASQPPLAGELATWEREIRAVELRRAIEAERATPAGEQQYAALRDGLARMLAPFAGRECEGLAKLMATPDFRRASRLAAVPAPARPAVSAPAPATARPSRAAASPAIPRGDIQGYGLVTTFGLGYGGMVTTNFEPVVLFKSGDLLRDLKGLGNPAGPAADRAANPNRWTRWRLAGGVYEYAQTDGKWGKVFNNKVWSSPPTTSLRGRYVTTGGGGATAMGGTDAVFVQASFEFQPGGRVVREGFAGASSSVEAGGSRTSTVTGSRQGARAGRYAVEGVFMTIAYDDGAREQVTLMTHPNDPDIIWINGSDYVRRTK